MIVLFNHYTCTMISVANSYTTFTVSKPPAATSHDQTKIDMGDRQLAQEHLASQPYGMSMYVVDVYRRCVSVDCAANLQSSCCDGWL